MNTNSEPTSDEKTPSFFLDDDKTGKGSLDFQNKSDETVTNETLSNIHGTKVPKTISGIHWPSLVIGAGIAVACIFCGVLMVNMINSETTSILDETPQKQTELAKKQQLSLLVDNASPVLGNPNAPITMIEFGDYQCTFCSKFFHETENSIVTNYIKTGKVKILFKDFVILGQDSRNAANAAHCANDQELFWEYHSILYNNWAGEDTGWADLTHLHEFANTLGLDMDVFSACMSNFKYNELVTLSSIDGEKLGVSGTPTFFVIDQNNDVIKITGAQSYDVFKQVFDSVLKD
ncbi:putative disulfide bond formation protein D [Marine Group I thaumarchaeote SCGC AAA799-O18]|nr:putative disulfide bond formation protein D [Marine Group I thaumarchaeote SCGC AAA799-O18]